MSALRVSTPRLFTDENAPAIHAHKQLSASSCGDTKRGLGNSALPLKPSASTPVIGKPRRGLADITNTSASTSINSGIGKSAKGKSSKIAPVIKPKRANAPLPTTLPGHSQILDVESTAGRPFIAQCELPYVDSVEGAMTVKEMGEFTRALREKSNAILLQSMHEPVPYPTIDAIVNDSVADGPVDCAMLELSDEDFAAIAAIDGIDLDF